MMLPQLRVPARKLQMHCEDYSFTECQVLLCVSDPHTSAGIWAELPANQIAQQQLWLAVCQAVRPRVEHWEAQRWEEQYPTGRSVR